MSGWNASAFDRWLTSQPEDDECKLCGKTLGETEDCDDCQEYSDYQREIKE